MKSKVGIADAFGRLVEVGDTVVYKGKQKYLEKGQVTKVTPLGVTVDHKVNIRSERIYMANKGMQSSFRDNSTEFPMSPWNRTVYPRFYCDAAETTLD